MAKTIIKTAKHVFGQIVFDTETGKGEQRLTTEAECPFCNKANVYVHIDSHYSLGNWYGCSHLKAMNYSLSSCIDSVEFSNI